ncbi:MAG: hypothetical protein JSV09_06295 [Thermoplasmata archaeon]|nr:MAG: hypothetical protein JSV09_06295 [Thermoplasmata archaeon]
MEELTLLGVIYVIVGLILALFMFITLVLTLFGILLLIMGRKHSKHKYMRYPMFMSCGSCGMQIEVNSASCQYCQVPTSP